MAPQQEIQQPQFLIEKAYLKDSSYEAPHTPGAFRADWKPKVNLDINSRAYPLNDNIHEVVLTLTVTCVNNEKTAYLVEVQYAGIYTLKDFEKEQLSEILGSFCPSLLYPYACQEISDRVTKGGFPQLNLQPINFEALYRESLQREQQTKETVSAETTE